MAGKTYYLGKTISGAIVGRASAQDYGYTHAGIRNTSKYAEGAIVPLTDTSFSRSSAGAANLVSDAVKRGRSCEVVPVEIVDRAAYKAATGKA